MAIEDFRHSNSDVDDVDESLSFLGGSKIETQTKRRWTKVNWFLGGISILLLLGIGLQEQWIARIRSRTGSYEIGFATDFEPARAAVEIEQVSFTGGLSYDEKGKLFREVDENVPQYVGLPGPHLDKSWKDLMAALEVVVGENEADVKGKTIEEPDGESYRLSVDVYHSLHCVNMIRQALDVDYYHRNGEVEHVYRIHTDHCLDYLRQTISCSGDLTPLYYQYSAFRGRGFPVWGAKHTCRNFGKIHEWAMAHHREQPEGGEDHGGHGH